MLQQRFLVCECSTSVRANELAGILNSDHGLGGGAVVEVDASGNDCKVFVVEDVHYSRKEIAAIKSFGKAWSKMIDLISI